MSLSYLEQLFGKLRRRQLVSSVRGPGGGYCLAKPLEGVSVAEIIHAVDETLDATNCGGKGNCAEDMRPCMTHELWTSLNEKMFEYLSSVTLADLVAQQRERTGQTAVIHDERPLRRVRRPAEQLAAA
jgi:Rrf2 family iron-sulfur cluster assembly transcriptional regulator